MEETENRTVNIDGVEHNFDDLSETAQDAIIQLANLQNKQANIQSEYNQLEMARKGYLAILNQETSDNESDKAADTIVTQ